MQRLRETFRRRQNTLEAQAKAEANKIQQHQRQQQSRSPSTPTHGVGQSSSRSPTNSTFDEVWLAEPSPPLSPIRNETSLSFSSNPSNEDIEEEEEEDNDQFDLNMSCLTLNEISCRKYISDLCSDSPPKKTCLEVPNAFEMESDSNKQIRSASFDETRSHELMSGANSYRTCSSSLSVSDSSTRNIRSHSFDYAAVKSDSKSARAKQQYQGTRTDSTTSGPSTFLDVPKWKLLIRRPSSSSQSTISDSGLKDCIHCVLLAQMNLTNSIENLTPPDSIDSECSSYNEDDEKENQTTTCDDKTESSGSQPFEAVDEFMFDDFIEPIEGLPIVTLCPPEADSPCMETNEEDTGITVISLEVPVLAGSKQARSASVDSPYLLQVPKRTDIEVREGPPKARSKSVDIVLPVQAGGPYLIVPPLRQQQITTK